MYIHDVIANLREKDLELANEIHALRHAIRMLEVYYPVPPVSRETTPGGNGSTEDDHATLF